MNQLPEPQNGVNIAEIKNTLKLVSRARRQLKNIRTVVLLLLRLADLFVQFFLSK